MVILIDVASATGAGFMSSSKLVVHRGGQVATRDQVAAVVVPPATDSWHPVAHMRVLSSVEELLAAAGYTILREQLALAREGARFFATLDLESSISEGVTLALGLRNSIDKSFPYGLAGGTRTFVCDNLALTGDWDELTISRKHTRFGEQRFTEALSNGIRKLGQYREMEERRIEHMRSTVISDTQAYALFMRAFEADLLSHRVIRECLRQWNNPGFDWGEPTLWRLYNAMNTPLQKKAISNPQAFSYQTMKLIELVGPSVGRDEPELIDVTPSPKDALTESGAKL